MKRSPYPLQWPEQRSRTPAGKREKSKFFGTTVYQQAREVLDELRKLGASHVIITSNLPTRQDGLPYSDGKSEDPGVAVWFVQDGREHSFACDAWRTAADNLHAIALSIAALRGLGRWGMADAVSGAMAGFAALPAGAPEVPRKRTWREIFAIQDIPGVALTNADLMAIVKSRHRSKIATAHPDAGGSTEEASELNAALDEAIAELGRT